MRTIVYAAGAIVLFAAAPAAAQYQDPPYAYSEWSNGFGPRVLYGGGGRHMSYAGSAREAYETAQALEGICMIGTIASYFAPLAGLACLPSQLMGMGQMYQQPYPRHYAEARPHRRVVRRHNRRPQRVQYASRNAGESEEQRFGRLLGGYLERNNLMLAPRVERTPVPPMPPPTAAPRTEAPVPESPRRIIEARMPEVRQPIVLVNAQQPQRKPRAVFTRSAILRGDLVGHTATRLAVRSGTPEPQAPEPKQEIDTRLIQSAMAVMR